MEVHDIVQEAGIKTIPKKKKCKKAKWLSGEALQIAEKRREDKGTKRKDISIWMQSSKDKQVEIKKPSSVINKEIEENNSMGKTRDLFKKIGDTKWTFHAKMGSIKDRNAMALTEAEDIKKRWQEYTEQYKKKSSRPR